MTNFEYLSKRTAGLGLTDDDIELFLLRGELEANDPVKIAHCDHSLYKNFSIIRKATAKEIREGGYTLSWDREMIEALKQDLGMEQGDRKNIEQIRNPGSKGYL